MIPDGVVHRAVLADRYAKSAERADSAELADSVELEEDWIR